MLQEAISCFSAAISIQPNNADFYHNRGFSYRKANQFSKAIAEYTAALRVDSRHFKAFYNR